MGANPNRFLVGLALLGLPLLLTQCGRPGTPVLKGAVPYGPAPVGSSPTPTEFLYVTSSNHDGEIISFPIDRNSGMLGVPTSVPGPLTASGIAPAQNQFLYVSSEQQGIIDAYQIDQTNGTLTIVSSSPFSPSGQTSFAPLWLVAGSAVYTTAQNGISGFTIGFDGGLSTVVGSPYLGGLSGQAVLAQTNTTASNTFLYATNSLDPEGRISGFRIVAPASGVLTPVPGNFVTGTSTGPGAIVFDGVFSTPYLFVALNNTNQIATFSVDSSTGALTPVPGSPFFAGFAPAVLALDATQKFLYAVNRTDGTISGYGIGADGSTIPVVGSPFVVGTSPGSIAVTPDNYLYVTFPNSNVIEGFAINSSDGRLTALAPTPFSVAAPGLLSVVDIPSP